MPATDPLLPGRAAARDTSARRQDPPREAATIRPARPATLAAGQTGACRRSSKDHMAAGGLNLARLLRPYWKLLAVAFGAMLIQAGADLLEPWPLKVIFDHVLGSKPMPQWLSAWMTADATPLAVLNAAALAVIGIAIIGAVGAYTEKYLSTAVAKHVGYDLRRLLYHHVQRLSLSFYEKRQTGDMVVRLTSDIDAAEDLISSAALGILLNSVTLIGMM